MKKKIALLLSTLLIFTMITACGSDKGSESKQDGATQNQQTLTAEEIMGKCLEKAKNADSMDMTMTMKMDMEFGGESMSQNIGYDIQMNNATNEKLEMAAIVNMDMGTENMSQTMYYKDGVYYMDMLGEKYKMTMNPTEVLASMGGANSLIDMDISDFASLESEEDGEGYSLKFVLNTTAFSDMANSFMGEFADGAELSVENISGVFHLNSDFMPEEITMDMKMAMNSEGMEIAVNANCLTTYESIGEHIDITFPNFDEYEEMAY